MGGREGEREGGREGERERGRQGEHVCSGVKQLMQKGGKAREAMTPPAPLSVNHRVALQTANLVT